MAFNLPYAAERGQSFGIVRIRTDWLPTTMK